MSQMNLLNLTEQDEDTLKGKYLIFAMGADMYGIEIRYVTEIISIQPITEVPDLPDYVMGITNLRGKIIPIIDARMRFKKPPREYDDRTCIIVLDTEEVSVGLIVDSVAEVLSLKDEDIAAPPEINRTGHRYVKGIGKTGGGVKLLLDCQRLLTDDEIDAISAAL